MLSTDYDNIGLNIFYSYKFTYSNTKHIVLDILYNRDSE